MNVMTLPSASALAILAVQRRHTAAIGAQVPVDMIPQAQRTFRARIADVVARRPLGATGETSTLWRPAVDGFIYMECGALVARPFRPGGGVVASALPAGRAAYLDFTDDLKALPAAWAALFARCETEGLALAGINWEIHAPRESAPSQRTDARLYALMS